MRGREPLPYLYRYQSKKITLPEFIRRFMSDIASVTLRPTYIQFFTVASNKPIGGAGRISLFTDRSAVFGQRLPNAL